LTIAYFHMVSQRPAANLLIVPLAFVIMVTACLSLVVVLFPVFWRRFLQCELGIHKDSARRRAGVGSDLPVHFSIGNAETAPLAVTVFDFGAGGASAIESGGRSGCSTPDRRGATTWSSHGCEAAGGTRPTG